MNKTCFGFYNMDFGNTSLFDLRTREQLKIHCGEQHFKALENGVEMRVATDWSTAKVRL